MPVLPLVASSRILPGLNFPLRRPSATMLAAARSFTEPPGLCHSALPKSVTLGKMRGKLIKTQQRSVANSFEQALPWARRRFAPHSRAYAASNVAALRHT